MGECFSLPYFKRRYSVSNNAEVTLLTMECQGPIEPRCEKTGLGALRPGLYNHRRWLDA